MRTMTDHARTRKGRSSTAAERIVTAGLATATCIGVVGLLGTRMVSAQEATAEPAPESTPVLLAAPASTSSSTVATSSSGMTRSDLDAYAALLAAEKARLDSYRAELVAAAHAINGATSSAQSSGRGIGIGSTANAGKSAKPEKTGSGKAAGQAALPQAPPAVPAIPAPAVKPAPKPAAPPALAAPAPAPQSYTAGS
jgi:hypothetical protein